MQLLTGTATHFPRHFVRSLLTEIQREECIWNRTYTECICEFYHRHFLESLMLLKPFVYRTVPFQSAGGALHLFKKCYTYKPSMSKRETARLAFPLMFCCVFNMTKLWNAWFPQARVWNSTVQQKMLWIEPLTVSRTAHLYAMLPLHSIVLGAMQLNK